MHVLWPVCNPCNSISNVVLSWTTHDAIYICIYIYKRCSSKHETLVEGQRHVFTEHHAPCVVCDVVLLCVIVVVVVVVVVVVEGEAEQKERD